MLHIPGLYILSNDKGRGIYTSEALHHGDVIEICPLIKIPKGQLLQLDQTIIYEYYFLWEEEGYEACLALGYGSLYNHSSKPNAEILMDYDGNTIQILATTKIEAGDEILIDYTGGGTKSQVKLWFDVKS